MLGAVVVLGGVLVLRGIAAADVAAFHAQPDGPTGLPSSGILTHPSGVLAALKLLWGDGAEVLAEVHGWRNRNEA
jgi:hypothetical protein